MIIIDILQLNDKVGWKLKKRKKSGWIQIPFKYKKHSMKNIQTSKMPPSTTAIIAKGDSSVFNQYFPLRDIEALHNVVVDTFSPTVV